MIMIDMDSMYIIKLGLGIIRHCLIDIMNIHSFFNGTPCILSSSMAGFAESPAV